LPRHRLHGAEGRGTPHHFGVADEVHILTGTLGKALGGAIGGYIAGPQPVIDLLRQRARPYLFSNALPPAVCRRRDRRARSGRKGDDLRARSVRQRRLLARGLETISASTSCPANTRSSR
jgi:glycine C-acetyltransferase